MKFRGDNVCKQVFITDNVKETGKIKILQIAESVYTVGHGYMHLWLKR